MLNSLLCYCDCLHAEDCGSSGGGNPSAGSAGNLWEDLLREGSSAARHKEYTLIVVGPWSAPTYILLHFTLW